jgi:hypothetical protein
MKDFDSSATLRVRRPDELKLNAPAFAGACCFGFCAPAERISYFAVSAAE